MVWSKERLIWKQVAPFFLTFPLYLKHCPLCPAKPPCFGPQTGIYKEKSRPFFSSIWSKERLIWKQAAPFFLTFPLYLKHCPLCPAKPPCFGPQTGIYKEKSRPLFSSIWSKERLIWKKAAPFFLTFPFILNTAHRVQPNPPVLAHNGHLKGKSCPLFPQFPLFTLTTTPVSSQTPLFWPTDAVTRKSYPLFLNWQANYRASLNAQWLSWLWPVQDYFAILGWEGWEKNFPQINHPPLSPTAENVITRKWNAHARVDNARHADWLNGNGRKESDRPPPSPDNNKFRTIPLPIGK